MATRGGDQGGIFRSVFHLLIKETDRSISGIKDWNITLGI